ncbi:MAG TPA: hypothetical protein VGE86_12165, partial [Thermoanaerobaculia bacterium]
MRFRSGVSPFAEILLLCTVFTDPAVAQAGPEWPEPDAAQAWTWVPVASGTTQTLRDVHFSSASFGWIGGDNLTIPKSTNGGTAWTPMSPKEGWATASDCCMSAGTREQPSQEAWLAGPKKALRFSATSNTGAYAYGEVVLHAVFPIPGSDVVWYGGSTLGSGGSLRLYRKSSAGTLTVLFFTSGTVEGIAFATEEEGWAVGTGGRLVHVTNGKAAEPTVAVQSAPTGAKLNAISLVGPSSGWIVGDGGTIVWLNNGNPALRHSGVVNNLRDITFRDASRGAIVGDGGLILVTADGGSSWTIEPSGTSVDLLGVSWAGESAVAVGASGTILMRT